VGVAGGRGEADTAGDEGKGKVSVELEQRAAERGVYDKWVPLNGRRQMGDPGRPGHIVSEERECP